MAEGQWGKLEILTPDFTPLEELANWIDAIKEALNVVVTLLETLLNFLSALADPLATLIQQIIDKIKEAISSLLDDVGIYGILIPNNKRFYTSFMGLGDVTPPALTKFFPPDQGLNDPNITPEQRRFLINANKFNGGNAGFYRTTLLSMHDPGDRNRPQFTSKDDWVGGLVMVLGSALDPFGFLDDLWTLKGLFGNLFESNMISKVPTASGLKAEALTRPGPNGGSGGKFSVLLQWDSMDVPFARLPDLGNTIIVPERQAIIMVKNDIQAATAQNVVQLMGTRELSQGDTTPSGNATVIFEDDFNISKVSHIHEITDVNQDDTYYFAIAYKNKAWKSGEDWTVDPGYALGYFETSNIARVSPFPTLPGSTPPDWIRTPSFADLFPDLAYLLRLMVAKLEDLANRLLGPGDMFKKYIEFLKAEIQRYEALVNDILDRIKKLIEMLKTPEVAGGAYVRTFKGKGGNQFFLSDLAQSLDEGFPNAPPFHRGDEYVMGIILMAGGSEAIVDVFRTLLSIIFWTPDDGADDLLGSLGDTIDLLEEQCFGDDLTTITCDIEEFTDILDDGRDVQCTAPRANNTVFGDDLLPETS
jgi:hypothetical protein